MIRLRKYFSPANHTFLKMTSFCRFQCAVQQSSSNYFSLRSDRQRSIIIPTTIIKNKIENRESQK